MWGYGTGMAWAWVFGALVLAGLVIIIVLLVRRGTDRVRNSLPDPAPTLTPRHLLDERYARGELTTEQYREHVETMRSTN